MSNNKLVEKLRHSSREIARELGMLASGQESGLPPSVCHTLIELEQHSALNLLDLANILNLDKSTITRIVQGLKKKKLVTVSADQIDQRFKRVMLTEAGKNVVSKINETASRQVQDALACLSHDEQAQIVSGFDLYAKALKRQRLQNEFIIRPIQKRDNIEIMMIIKKILKEFGADRPGFAFTDDELDDMYHAFTNKKSLYLVVVRKKDEKVMGGAGFGVLAGGKNSVCELKKMYLLPDIRGRGLASMLAKMILSQAKEYGYKQCYLETIQTMGVANALYKKFGFNKVDKPLGNTGHCGCDSWYLRNL